MEQRTFDFTRIETAVFEMPLEKIAAAPTRGLPSVRASIDALGAASAVLLRPLTRYEGRVPDPFGTDPIYEIVDGRKRVDAARAAGLDTIPAIVIQSDSDAETLALTAAMNLNRGPSPLEEARAIAALLERGFSREALVSIGFKAGTIAKRIRLARAPAVLLDAVAEGRIAASTAEEVANLPDYQQEEAVLHFQEHGRLTVRDVRHLREARKTEEVAALPDELFTPVEPDEAPARVEAGTIESADPVDAIRAFVREAAGQGVSRGAILMAVVESYPKAQEVTT